MFSISRVGHMTAAMEKEDSLLQLYFSIAFYFLSK